MTDNDGTIDLRNEMEAAAAAVRYRGEPGENELAEGFRVLARRGSEGDPRVVIDPEEQRRRFIMEKYGFDPSAATADAPGGDQGSEGSEE